MAENKNTPKSCDPLKWLQKRAQEAEERLKKAAEAPKVVQLPVWPEAVRGVPNSILRSALFGAIRRGRRRYLQGEIIAAVDGIRIRQTGPKLDQADLDVWEQCLHLSRQQLGVKIEFTAYSFLSAIGRHHGKSGREWLMGAFRRLMATVVEIEDGKRAYFGPLLHHGARDDETGHYVIELNPKIAALYGYDGWTAIEWQQRLSLSSPLAKWLHGFYSSHAEPYPIKVETLHRLCGSENKQLFGFRRELREALRALETATGWKCWIDQEDLVHVEKKPSPSQTRHLIQKKLGKDKKR